MRRLVALDLPPGPQFVTAIARAFDSSDAIAPIDQRLSGSARNRIIRALLPTDIIDGTGERHRMAGGRDVDPEDAVVVATSGTTGDPKGVVLTHHAVRASAIATSAALGVDPSADHWLCSLPLNHVGGLSIVLRSLVTETPLTVIERFDLAQIAAALAAGVTLTSLVPTTLSRLGRRQSDRFRGILLGGSAMPNDLPDNVITTYGMTETGSGVVYNRQPLPGVEVELGEGGAIALRCPMLLRCYRDGSDPKDARGFFQTGDIGSIDAGGCLTVLGRSSDLIISGGENIWPTAVEGLFIDAPGVQEIGVVGVEDAEWGQRMVGALVASGDSPPSIEDLNERCRAEIGPWATFKEIRLVEAMPRTAIGKIDRRALARLFGAK